MDRKIIRDLKAHATAENREVLKRFFKTGKGEYGYGDVFSGSCAKSANAIAPDLKSTSNRVTRRCRAQCSVMQSRSFRNRSARRISQERWSSRGCGSRLAVNSRSNDGLPEYIYELLKGSHFCDVKQVV